MTHVLKEITTSQGVIKIVKEGNQISYYQNGMCQSQVSAVSNNSTFGYINTAYNDIVSKKYKEVLMLGCGAGMLASMLHRIGCRVTVVDMLQESFDIAKEHFNLPVEITCITEDAVTFVKENGKRFDGVLLDCFDGKGKPPEGFVDNPYDSNLNCLVNSGGTIYVNAIHADYSILVNFFLNNRYSISKHRPLIIAQKELFYAENRISA